MNQRIFPEHFCCTMPNDLCPNAQIPLSNCACSLQVCTGTDNADWIIRSWPGGELRVAAAFEVQVLSQRSDLKLICQLQFFLMLYFEIYGGLSKGLKRHSFELEATNCHASCAIFRL